MSNYALRKIGEAEARGDMEAARRWRYVAELVAAAPPLSAAQRARLGILLHPPRSPAGTP